jgi:hypothetical protein
MRSRQAARQPVVAHGNSYQPRALSDLEAQANKIAAVPADMLPPLYRKSPGACMLAIDWANRNNVSILEAIGEVAFVYGKPVVSARLQKRMAARAGYRTQKISGDETQCTVAVYGPDNVKLGEATYTIQMARALGITGGASKKTWDADPAQMLFHRATTRALDHYGPADLAPMFADEVPEYDPVEMAAANAVARGEDPDTIVIDDELPAIDPPAPIEPVIDINAADYDPAEIAAQLDLAAGSVGKNRSALVKQARAMGHQVTDFDTLAGNVTASNDVLDWLEQL